MPLHACGGLRTFRSLFFPSSLGRREQHKFSGLHDKCFNSLSRLLGPICLYSFYDLAELPFCPRIFYKNILIDLISISKLCLI